MKNILIIYLQMMIVLSLLITTNKTFGENNNNAFVFNGESSMLSVLDGQPINADANQTGFNFFNSNSSNKQITVQAWVYLIGDTPPNTEIPIVYRTVNNGKTFYMYLKDNMGYFSIGNNNNITLNTNQLPAFQWVSITGTYDGSVVKIYAGGTLAASANFNITTGYTSTNGTTGLFIGKSSTRAFRGLMDEVRIFNVALDANNINNSGGNGTPSENIPTPLLQYLSGRWSFTEFSYYNGIKSLKDNSDFKNHLRIDNIDEIVDSKHLPFFVVNSTSDAPDLLPGDGTADAGNGMVTLRSAIQEANALAGFQKIYFYIPGNSPYRIQPGTPLPTIIEALRLNATTQRGYVGLPIIEVNGSLMTSPNINGLIISSGGCSITGLVINQFTGYGLSLTNSGANVIQGNFFGTNTNGATGLGNFLGGMFIGSGSSSNIIGGTLPNQRNLFSGNGGDGWLPCRLRQGYF